MTKEKKNYTPEFKVEAVRLITEPGYKPMDVWEYQLTLSLPDNRKGSLPSIEAIERALEGGRE